MTSTTRHARYLASSLSSLSALSTLSKFSTAAAQSSAFTSPTLAAHPSSPSARSHSSSKAILRHFKEHDRAHASRNRAVAVSKFARSQVKTLPRPLPRPSIVASPAFPSSNSITVSQDDLLKKHPYQGVTPTPERPFGLALHLLMSAETSRAQLDARVIVDAIHPSALELRLGGGIKWPTKLLSALLRMKMDSETLIRLFNPLLMATHEAQDVVPVHLFATYVTRAVHLSALPMVSIVSSLFIRRINEEVRYGASIHQILGRYEVFLTAFATSLTSPTWTRQSQSTTIKHSDPITKEVDRIVHHLMQTISHMPSTSTDLPSLALRPSLLRLVFATGVLSKVTLPLLLNHCKLVGFELEEYHLKGCVLLAMKNKDYDLVLNFVDQLCRGKRNSKSKAKLECEVKDSKTSTVKHVNPSSFHNNVKENVNRNVENRQSNKWELVRDIAKSLRGRTIGDVLEIFGTRLHDEADVGVLKLAWSLLATQSERLDQVTPSMLLSLADRIPQAALVGTTITPILYGLIRRGEPQLALQTWKMFLNHEENLVRRKRVKVLDATALSVAAEAIFKTSDLDTAIRFVDLYAARPPSCKLLTVAKSVIIDAACVNVLLGMCNRMNKPSLAFRLFAAAKPRWGVHLDGISLTLLLDIARFAEAGHSDGGDETRSGHGAGDSGIGDRRKVDTRSMMQDRFQMLADSFGLGIRVPECQTEGYEARLSTGPTTRLLDSSWFSWRTEFGPRRPWQMARDLFREIIFSNYPILSKVPSPLDHSTTALEKFASLFITSLPKSNKSINRQFPAEGSILHELVHDISDIQDYIPLPKARYLSLTLSPNAFHSYISLLGHFELADEIPLALGWMKELNIIPSRKCLISALLHIGQAEGPRRRVRGWGEDGSTKLVRDEDIMRRWLEGWLGREGQVPSEEEVAALSRAIQSRRMQARRASRPYD